MFLDIITLVLKNPTQKPPTQLFPLTMPFALPQKARQAVHSSTELQGCGN